jgi:hypothetical protein
MDHITSVTTAFVLGVAAGALISRTLSPKSNEGGQRQEKEAQDSDLRWRKDCSQLIGLFLQKGYTVRLDNSTLSVGTVGVSLFEANIHRFDPATLVESLSDYPDNWVEEDEDEGEEDEGEEDEGEEDEGEEAK